MKYKLYRKECHILKHIIYVIPTIRIVVNDLVYGENNISIEFHFITLHARLLFLEGRCEHE